MDKTKKTLPRYFKTTVVDEERLKTDGIYRFNYVSEVIGLNEEDHKIIRKHQQTVESQLKKIVDRIYSKIFDYDAMKKHFLPRHTGFEGELPASMMELSLDHDQTRFRKMKLIEYFSKLCTAEWDDTFAVMIDMVGHMHTIKEGNSALEVPVVQIVAILGFMNDMFLEGISKLELSCKTQLALQRAYSKLFWVQLTMFIRHWTVD